MVGKSTDGACTLTLNCTEVQNSHTLVGPMDKANACKDQGIAVVGVH